MTDGPIVADDTAWLPDPPGEKPLPWLDIYELAIYQKEAAP